MASSAASKDKSLCENLEWWSRLVKLHRLYWGVSSFVQFARTPQISKEDIQDVLQIYRKTARVAHTEGRDPQLARKLYQDIHEVLWDMISCCSPDITAYAAIELAEYIRDMTKDPRFAGAINILRRYVTVERKSSKDESHAKPR